MNGPHTLTMNAVALAEIVQAHLREAGGKLMANAVVTEISVNAPASSSFEEPFEPGEYIVSLESQVPS